MSLKLTEGWGLIRVFALTSTDDMAGSGALGDRSLLPGGPLYEARCASCHEGGVYKAPHKIWLEFMSARNLYKSMTGGIMSSQAEGLSDIEKRQIIEYLTMEPFKESDLTPEYQYCQDRNQLADPYDAKELVGGAMIRLDLCPTEVAGLVSQILRI